GVDALHAARYAGHGGDAGDRGLRVDPGCDEGDDGCHRIGDVEGAGKLYGCGQANVVRADQREPRALGRRLDVFGAPVRGRLFVCAVLTVGGEGPVRQVGVGQPLRDAPAVRVVGVEHRELGVAGSEQLRLGLEVVLEVGVEVEM